MYTVSEILHASSWATLYRAIRISDGKGVALKALATGHRPDHLTRLKNELEIGLQLPGSAVLKPLALDNYQGCPALVLEDFEGQALEGRLGAQMAAGDFLPLAIRIAGALACIHQARVVHKDIKPEKILLHRITGEIRIIDLAAATTLPCARQEGGVGLMEGSLPYMSPEQTGRMNRALDERSDLYSLGLTFYRMLTGVLPFQANDPLEWVYCHMARLPVAPAKMVPTMPDMLSTIVMKLLAKDPEERYQSARGLQHDLEQCLEQWRTDNRIKPFALDRHDASNQFHIPQKLYGREVEIAILRTAFERVADTGMPELALVSGYAGSGKSTLVQELYKPIVQKRGFLASGKFDQYKRDIPYSTVVQAFTELVQELLTESDDQIASWKTRLQAALGDNGQLIVNVIPPVEFIIGAQAPVAALPAADAQNRFRNVFRDFINVFAQEKHPLALFLDDLQWADLASLSLLQDLITSPQMRHFFLVGAYRDNEVSTSHPLMLTLEEVRKAGADVTDVALGPLSNASLGTLIGEASHNGHEDVMELAGLLQEKTAGNPFFAIQFLTALHEDQLIRFDPAASAWRWNIRDIQAKSFTDNVVDLMLAKLQRLPAATRHALTQLACLGASAKLANLALVLEQPEDEVKADLTEALRSGLIFDLGGTCKFLHDRVQEAAYSLIPEAERGAVHLKIGRLLKASMPQAAVSEQAFDLVNQFNQGIALITDAAEKQWLSQLNFFTGKRAKASIAYASAVVYMRHARSLLPPDSWSADYHNTLESNFDLAECEYLLGNTAEAEKLCDEIQQHARSRVDRARVYSLRARQYQFAGNLDKALALFLEALQLFDLTFPTEESAIGEAIGAESEAMPVNMGSRSIPDLLDAPIITDLELRATIDLFVDAQSCAYLGNSPLFPLLCLKSMNFSLKHGNFESSCFIYSCYGVVVLSAGDIDSAYALSEMSLQLNERFNDPKFKGIVLCLHGTFIHFWKNHLSRTLPIIKQAFLSSVNVGNMLYAGYSAYTTVQLVLEKGEPIDEFLKFSEPYEAFAKQSGNDLVYQMIRCMQQFALNLKGSTREETSFDDDDFSEAECLEIVTLGQFAITDFHIMKHVSAYMYGRYEEALAHGEKVQATMEAALAGATESTYHLYHALTLTALYPAQEPVRQEAFSRELDAHLAKMQLWAEKCPENYANRLALMSAEIARVKGREMDAMRLYEEAIHSANENGFTQNEALANELAARFYIERGFRKNADAYLLEARLCYLRWGAARKVAQLEKKYPQLRPLRPATADVMDAHRLDALSIVKASHALSSAGTLDKLLENLLKVVIEQAGAQKGYVLMLQDGTLAIEAEVVLDETGAAIFRLLQSLPANSSSLLPVSIVNYAWRTRNKVLLDNASVAPKFSMDEYIARIKPKSVLCQPVFKQSELVGMIYLENNLVSGAFKPETSATLDLLTSQAAISLENARLQTFLQQENIERKRAEQALQKHEKAIEALANVVLLESKLAPPDVPARLLPVPRLEKKFEAAFSRRLICLIAPAGYGKTTTLIKQLAFLESKGIPYGWLSLDKEDNDPIRFLHYVIVALQRVEPSLGRDALAQMGYGAGIAVEVVLLSLCNDLAKLQTELVLVLDDYHTVDNSAVHAALEVLMARSSRNLKLCIASRSALQLTVSKLRLADDIYEFPAEELSLHLEETGSFVSAISGRELTALQVKSLHERTEGWPAGLQFVSLALKKTDNIAAFIRDFSGSDKDTTTYLGEIVLCQLPLKAREFVMRSALFDRFSAEFCKEVLAEQETDQLIGWISVHNLFLVPLDRQHQWYRYHHLFADYLRNLFTASHPEETRALYRTGSDWFERKGSRNEAIRYAFAAEDYGRAMDLIAGYTHELIDLRGEHSTLLNWLAALPPSYMDQRPDIKLSHIWSLMLTQRYREVEEGFASMERILENYKAHDMTPEKEAFLAILSRKTLMMESVFYGLFDRTTVAMPKCLDWLAKWEHCGEHFEVGCIWNTYGYGACVAHDYALANQALTCGFNAMEKAGSYYGMSWVYMIRSLVTLEQGNVLEAEHALANGHKLISEKLGPYSYGCSLLALQRIHICYERNRIDEAEEILEGTFLFANQHGLVETSASAYVTKARILWLQGKADEADACLIEGVTAAGRMEMPRLALILNAERIHLLLKKGQVGRAVTIADSIGFSTESADARHRRKLSNDDIGVRIIDVRLQLATGQTDRTHLLVGDLLTEARRHGRNSWVIKLLCLKAVLQASRGKRDEARRSLDEALTLGAAGGQCRTFADEGPQVAELIQEIADRRAQIKSNDSGGVPYEYLMHVLNAFEQAPDQSKYNPAAASSQVKNDAFSEREIQILKLVDSGLGNRDLAAQLFLSEATIKWHLHNIYNKLHVSNRTSALAKARELLLV